MRRQLPTIIVIAAVILISIFVRALLPSHPSPITPPPLPPPIPVANAPRPPQRLKKQTATSVVREVKLWDTNSLPVTPQISQLVRQSSATAPISSSAASDLFTRLSQLGQQKSLTPEQAAEINQLLQQLIAQGPASIPAIREFLASKQDINFDSIPGGEYVDFGSLRLGLIGALEQIKGPEAIQALAQTLQSTTDPIELAFLTSGIEDLASNQFRSQEIAAARQALALAAAGKLPNVDASPLFEILQKYGDASVVPDLQNVVSKWNYWATLALAGLPDGAGIPGLIELAQNPSIAAMENGDLAFRPLAQVALQYPDALNALLASARANQIPDRAWPGIAAAFEGNYLQYGRPLLLDSPPANWSDAQIQARVAMIDQMLAATSSPTARQALQTARTVLLSRAH